MRVSKISAVVGLLLLAQGAWAAPKVQQVTLKHYTTHVVFIPSGMGTKFIFPTPISESSPDYPPFSKTITNTVFTSQKADVETMADLNSLVIYLPPGKNDLVRGNLFMNYSGYEISVELVSTSDFSKHVSDVFFVLSKEKRESLIQELVNRRLASLQGDLDQKKQAMGAELDRKVMNRLGEIILSRKSSKNIKEEKTLSLKDGGRVVLYVDEIIIVGNYGVIPFELNYDGGGEIPLRGAKVFLKTGNNPLKILDSAVVMPPKIEGGKKIKGTATVHSDQLKSKEKIVFAVQLDEQQVEVSW